MVDSTERSLELDARAAKIKLVVLDVDGVLTDGGMYYSESGDELKKFNTRDGKAIEILRDAGFTVVIITQESTKLVARRAEKLRVDLLLDGITDKAAALRDVARRFGVSLDEIAYVGDDVNDLGAMRIAGLAVTVADGMPCTKDIAQYVTAACGGAGAVRELSLLLVPRQGYQPVRAGILLLCRMDSSRLPGKVVAPVLGRPLIEYQIERLKTAQHASCVVVCTTTSPADDSLVVIAERHGLASFRGDPEDVVVRMRDAARAHDLDIVISIGADDPLSDPGHADAIIERLRGGDTDFMWYPDLPLGASPYGVTAAALGRLCRTKTGGGDGWERYFIESGRFRVVRGAVDDAALRQPELRLTLDYPEDLEFFRRIFAELYPAAPAFTLRHVVDLLRRRPDIAEMNRAVAARWREQHRAFDVSIAGEAT